MTKTEFPCCTVFTVAMAIICHILVLVGNLETAQTLHAMGESSSGWSDVGLSLGSSLHNELDHLMHDTASKLTGALNVVVQVETDIGYVLAGIANATGNALSMVQTSGLKSANSGQHLGDEDCAGGNCGDVELASMLQSSVDVCEETARGVPGDELASLLQGKVQMQLVASQEEKTEDKQGQTTINSKVDDFSDLTIGADTRATLHAQIRELVKKVQAGVHRLLEVMKPALLQIGNWLKTMGPKMQGVIEEFSIVIDRVQKIIDEVMAKIAGTGPHGKLLLHEVFAIFDVSGTGSISMNDMHKVAILYGVTALQHTKGEQLLKKYDADKDKSLSKQEFSLMVEDKSIPKASTVILRTYSRKLAEVASAVAAARQRDEIAHSVVQYFTLVCAKNTTKIAWVSQALTNGTLPLEFVADVLKEFAQNVDNPGIAEIVDAGAIVIKEMVHLSPNIVSRALKLLADPQWWHQSGFDPAHQPKMVKRVSHWVVQAGGKAVIPHLLQVLAGNRVNATAEISTANAVALTHDSVRRSSRQFTSRQHAVRAKELEAFLSADASVGLFQSLLGGEALRAEVDPDVARVVSGGVKAKPETLRFAHWLASNASETVQYFQHMCFDHSHTSSNTVDSLATKIQGMLKKTQNFLRLMQRYSTPHGMEVLEARIDKFLNHALQEVLSVVDKKLHSNLAGKGSHNTSLLQKDDSIKGVWKEVTKFTKDLKSILPAVIDDIKFAKKEVSAVSGTMMSMFPVFKTKGTPIFESVKSLYATMWIVYFITFAVLSLCILFYGFWASGYFGGPAAGTDGQTGADAVPSSPKDRCMSCFRACIACVDRCPDTNLCYWSCIIVACVVVLIMFILSSVLGLLAGLKIWVGAGCDEVYLLNDNAICVGAMKGIQYWLSTFWSQYSNTPLESMCTSRTLMTCQAISVKMKQSALFTTGGSLLASIFTCQMIFESARLHEKSSWMRLIQENKVELLED